MWYKFSGAIEIKNILHNPEDIEFINNNFPINKFKSTMAYFKDKIPDKELYDLYNSLQILENKKSLSLQASKHGVYLNGTRFTDYQLFREYIDQKINVIVNPNHTNNPGELPKLNNKKISVIKINTPEEACTYGQQTNWCLGEPGSGEFYNLKRNFGYTYYFVFDPLTDDPSLKRTCVIADENNSIQVYNIDNETIQVNEYMQYLKTNGVDLHQFKADKLSYHEKQLFNILSYTRNLEDYKRLSYNEKSFYNQYGPGLSEDILLYLIEHSANDLIQKYMKSGKSIEPRLLELLKNNQLSTYHKYRQRNLDNIVNHFQNQEDQLTIYASGHNDYELIKYIFENDLYNDENDYLLENYKGHPFVEYVNELRKQYNK